MKVAIAWPRISGYFAACVRSLIAQGVEVRVYTARPAAEDNAPFSLDVMDGLSCDVVDVSSLDDPASAVRTLGDFSADALLVGGWHHRAFRGLLFDRRWRDVPAILGMDNIPRGDRGSLGLGRVGMGTWRQRLAPIALRRVLRRVDRWFVPGERSRQLLRSWGVDLGRIERGLYAVDEAALTPAWDARRRAAAAPRSFLFVGQYISRKGIDGLLAAYRLYRERVGETSAWPLVCCGHGPEPVEGPGVDNRGFLAPEALAPVLAEAGVLVLPSRLDHWGQVVAEAALAGVPVVATTECGVEVELIRDRVNGRSVPADDTWSLLGALAWSHARTDDELRAAGETSRHLALPYTSAQWARKVREMVAELAAAK